MTTPMIKMMTTMKMMTKEVSTIQGFFRCLLYEIRRKLNLSDLIL